jgi:putative membrane protein
MKTNYVNLVMLFLMLGFHACNSTNQSGAKAKDSSEVDKTEVDSLIDTTKITSENGIEGTVFLEKAAKGNLLEIEMGKLAETKGANKSIKEYGGLLKSDHTKAFTTLKSLAKAKGIKLPESVSSTDAIHFEEMSRMSGESFDKHFVQMMIKDHNKDIEFYSGVSKSPDTTISVYASKLLPTLQGHLKRATEIAEKLK